MRIMSVLGEQRPSEEDELVLVFRPPENPAAQVAVETPFRGHRVRLDELLDWFKALRVDSIELWIEGAKTSGKNTELFLSTEGKTGAKITLKPHPESVSRKLSLDQVVRSSPTNTPGEPQGSAINFSAKQVQAAADTSESPVTAFFSPKGGIEQQILTSIGGAVGTIEMAAYAAIRLISPPGGIMHDKFIIVDGKNVEWGSYNYTGRAENTNFENATFLSNGNLAQKYHSDFVSIYNQATPEAQGLRRPLRRFARRLRSPFKPKG